MCSLFFKSINMHIRRSPALCTHMSSHVYIYWHTVYTYINIGYLYIFRYSHMNFTISFINRYCYMFNNNIHGTFFIHMYIVDNAQTLPSRPALIEYTLYIYKENSSCFTQTQTSICEICV